MYEQGEDAAQDYDVPKTRYFTPEARECSDSMDSVDPNPTYDTPSHARRITVEVTPQIVYDCPQPPPDCLTGSAFGSSSNRSSTVSVHSNASNTTASSNSSNIHRSAPSSACHSARSSVEASGMDIYDVPPPPKAISDGPPASSMDDSLSKQLPLEIRDIYDSPSDLTANTNSIISSDLSNITPDGHRLSERISIHKSLLNTYDSPSALRSSLMSDHGELSDCEEKARMSAMELYDTPSRLKNLNTSKVSVHDVTGSINSDTSSYLDKSAYDDYDVPRSIGSARSSGDSGIESSKLDGIYDVPPKNVQDHDDVYDVPGSNSPMIKYALADFEKEEQKGIMQGLKTSKPSPTTVYDIPPQVTRDTQSSPKHGSVTPSRSKPDSNVSVCSVDLRGSELRLQVDAAQELLLKLQQDAIQAVKMVLAHVSPGWRQPAQLAPRIYNLRQTCHKLRTTLEELTQFGKGALANCQQLSNNKLSGRLAEDLQPLQIALSSLTHYLSMLTDRWDIPNLAVNVKPDDELDKIIKLAKSMPDKVDTLTSLIQEHSSVLFRSIDAEPLPSSVLRHPPKPEPIGTSTPKSKATPPPVRPKPKVSRNASFGQSLDSANDSDGEEKRGTGIQSRPLPPPPPVRPTREHSQPKTNLKTKNSAETKENNSKVKGDGEQEYDYVHLSPDTEDLPPMLPTKSSTRQSQLEGMSGPQHRTQSTVNGEHSASQAEQDDIPTKDTGGGTDSGEAESDSMVADAAAATEGVDSGRMSQCSEDLSSEGSGSAPVRTSGLSAKFQARLDRLQQEAQQEVQVHTTEPHVPRLPEKTKRHSRLCDSDRQILGFYTVQVDTHTDVLVSACDAFFNCIDYHQPPKVFIAHSRFVILAAHKLVYIADTITRYTYSEEVRNKITLCATELCGALKQTVSTTKQAALQYPAVHPLQDMVDRVLDVTHATKKLKTCITQAEQM